MGTAASRTEVGQPFRARPLRAAPNITTPCIFGWRTQSPQGRRAVVLAVGREMVHLNERSPGLLSSALLQSSCCPHNEAGDGTPSGRAHAQAGHPKSEPQTGWSGNLVRPGTKLLPHRSRMGAYDPSTGWTDDSRSVLLLFSREA